MRLLPSLVKQYARNEMSRLRNYKDAIRRKSNTMLQKHLKYRPYVYSIEETIEYITDNKCSVSRFGDGEFNQVLLKYGTGFQKLDNNLACHLRTVLKRGNDIPNFIICVPDIFGDLNYLNEKSVQYQQQYLDSNYLNLLVLLKNRKYFNSYFTRFYSAMRDKSKSSIYFDMVKKIWEGREILIVEGEKTRMGVGNDLFSSVKQISRVICPAENAYDKYDEIINAVMIAGKGKLILIALGMTATVLAYELAQQGFWAIDVGHIDIQYEWYISGMSAKGLVAGKYVNEVENGNHVDDSICDEGYYNSIIKVIL